MTILQIAFSLSVDIYVRETKQRNEKVNRKKKPRHRDVMKKKKVRRHTKNDTGRGGERGRREVKKSKHGKKNR